MSKNVYYYVDEYNKETRALIELFEYHIKNLKENQIYVTDLLAQYIKGEIDECEILEIVEGLLDDCNKEEPNWQ